MIVNNHYPSFFQWVVPMVNRYYFSDDTVEEDYVTEIVVGRFTNNTSLIRVDAPLVESIATGTSTTGAFARCTSLISVNLPNAVSIGAYAFSNCSSLISVNLPNAVSIGAYAFSNCSSLTNISLPNVASTGTATFMNCSSLTDVYLPKLTSIARAGGRSGTFTNCSSLVSLDLPKLSDVIDGNMFTGCTNLTHLYLDGCIDGKLSLWANINTAPNLKYLRIGLTSIRAGTSSAPSVPTAFKAETIELPNCTSIGDYAFGGMYSSLANQFLRTLIAPVCDTVGKWSFMYCSNLNSVDFGAKVDISQESSNPTQSAFANCASLYTLIFRGDTLSTIGRPSMLNGTPFETSGSGAHIYVPQALVNSYKSATNWSEYSEFIVPLEGSVYEDPDWWKD